MAQVIFAGGADVTVCAGTRVLGGVTAVTLRQEAAVYPIREFLTDKPAAQLCGAPAYELKLTLLAPRGADVGASLAAERVTLCDGERTVTLDGCVLTSVEDRLLPNRRTEYTATIAARNRSVSDAGGAAPSDGA